MALTVEQIIMLRRPTTTLDPTTTGLIEMAGYVTDAAAFGNTYDYARAMLVCHWLEMASRMDKVGPIASLSEGSLSISYASAAAGSDGMSYASTSYGQEYMLLQKKIPSFGCAGMNEVPKVEREYP
jgi:hypothetical protein